MISPSSDRAARTAESVRRTAAGQPRWSQGFALAVLLACLSGLARPAFALELYTLLDRGCRANTGLIVDADDESVLLMDTGGRLAVVPRDAVQRILVFNTLDNPISELELGGGLGALAREVQLEGAGVSPFIGWPIRFLETTIVFFDIEGKTHVEDIERIARIGGAPPLPERLKIDGAKAQAFVPGPDAAECPAPPLAEPPADLPAVYPTGIIGDQIKISKFLAAFYARPYLYERKTKLALQLGDFPYLELQELPAQLPLYLQWGSGSPFRSQGLFVFGSKPVEWLPNVEPVFALRTDLKSSFFTASFVGNPSALSAGKDFVIGNRFGFQEFFARQGVNDILVVPHLNHLVLTGIELASYSASLGYYYPLFGIYANGLFREVLSPRSSLIYRLLYTDEHRQFRLLYSQTSLGSNDPTGDDIQIVVADDLRNPSTISPESKQIADSLRAFSLDTRFLRAGVDFDLRNELQIGIDQVLFSGEYSETFPDSNYRLDFEHRITALHALQGFGDFAALRFQLNYFDRIYHDRADGTERSPRYQRFSLTVAIEFVL
jgi:hypothetical protein